MKPIRWLAIPIICTALLAGCETTRVAPAPAPPPVSMDLAEKAERSGDFLIAAREYTRLAEIALSAQKQDFQLRAVANFLKAGQLREARSQIELINVAALDSSFTARKRILQARIYLTEGGFEKGIRQLDEAGRLRNLSPALLSEINSVRAQAELALDNPVGAVRNLIGREQFLAGREAVAENQKQLWKILVSMPRERLKTEFNIARDPVLSGWLELALITAENAGQILPLQAALDQWKIAHPNHPANETIFGTLMSPTPGISGRIERIALLLPLSSGYSTAAQAVRDGFMGMDAANTNPDKPKIRIYDTGPDPTKTPDIYAQAIDEGAQFVVGPLGREAAEAILKLASIKVPTLMLNHTDTDPGTASKYLFEFGLPPEQEAQQVAERAYLDGHRQAAVLYPKTPWGERMMTAWANHWQRLGGTVVASQSYNELDVDYSIPGRERLWGGDASGRHDYHAVESRQVFQGIDLLAAAGAEDGAADQEQGHVGADLGGDAQAVSGRELNLQHALQPQHGGDGVGRGAAQAALHRQPFLDGDGDPGALAERAQDEVGNAMAGVRSVGGDAARVGSQLDTAAPAHADAHHIVQRDGLVHGAQLVKSIGARGTDAQADVDLGERANRDGHVRAL